MSTWEEAPRHPSVGNATQNPDERLSTSHPPGRLGSKRVVSGGEAVEKSEPSAPRMGM